MVVHATSPKRGDSNSEGILLYNPILNVYLNKNMAAQFAYSHGFVDEHLWNDFKANCCKGCVDPSNCDINFLRGECRYKASFIKVKFNQ
uniref:Uncharacterized protein n=1 Tax=Meloidogyne incognita TaxID=6306 RepID=A0A914MY79_MELIC